MPLLLLPTPIVVDVLVSDLVGPVLIWRVVRDANVVGPLDKSEVGDLIGLPRGCHAELRLQVVLGEEKVLLDTLRCLPGLTFAIHIFSFGSAITSGRSRGSAAKLA